MSKELREDLEHVILEIAGYDDDDVLWHRERRLKSLLVRTAKMAAEVLGVDYDEVLADARRQRKSLGYDK